MTGRNVRAAARSQADRSLKPDINDLGFVFFFSSTLFLSLFSFYMNHSLRPRLAHSLRPLRPLRRLDNVTARYPRRFFSASSSSITSCQDSEALDAPSSPLLANTTTSQTNDLLTTSLPTLISTNEYILTAMHQDMGLSWWAAIMLGTLALRTSLTLPVAVYQQKAIGKMINLAPMIQSWAETLKVSVAKETNRLKPDFAGYQKELDKQVKKTGV